jgi:hypothetical protein
MDVMRTVRVPEAMIMEIITGREWRALASSKPVIIS